MKPLGIDAIIGNGQRNEIRGDRIAALPEKRMRAVAIIALFDQPALRSDLQAHRHSNRDIHRVGFVIRAILAGPPVACVHRFAQGPDVRRAIFLVKNKATKAAANRTTVVVNHDLKVLAPALALFQGQQQRIAAPLERAGVSANRIHLHRCMQIEPYRVQHAGQDCTANGYGTCQPALEGVDIEIERIIGDIKTQLRRPCRGQRGAVQRIDGALQFIRCRMGRERCRWVLCVQENRAVQYEKKQETVRPEK